MLDKIRAREPRRIGAENEHHAAVVIALLPTPSGEYDILFTTRSGKIDSQPGDACFPGGMVEEGETPEEAVVREAREELLIADDQLELVGPGDIMVTSGLQVHSFAGILHGYNGTFSTDEVAEVFRVPLAYFLGNEPQRYAAAWKVELPEDFPYDKVVGGRNYKWRDRKSEYLFYEYEGHVIWGMTARILNTFVKILKEE